MLMSHARRIAPLAALLLAACATSDDPSTLRSDPFTPGSIDERRVQRLDLEQLYAAARSALDSSDYSTALELYGRLEARYPFTDIAIQARLETIYAHYRLFEPELALSAADRFLRANPRHENIDYVLYLRGLINFERSASDILDLLDFDSTGRDPINERRSFEDFGRLVQRFPTSPYAPDARQRMIHLRNRIAQHEFGIAQYYAKRRAWVAASRRAEEVIAKFQGTAVIPAALDLLAEAYVALDLPDRAERIRAVREASYPENTGQTPAAQAFAPAQPPPAAG